MGYPLLHGDTQKPQKRNTETKMISLTLLPIQASLVAQLLKHPPAKWETWVRSLGWEDPLEKGKATHPSILAWRIPWTVKSCSVQSLSRVQLFVTPQTVQSMEFSRPGYWSG